MLDAQGFFEKHDRIEIDMLFINKSGFSCVYSGVTLAIISLFENT